MKLLEFKFLSHDLETEENNCLSQFSYLQERAEKIALGLENFALKNQVINILGFASPEVNGG